jgi:hypothetical protein
MPTELVERLRAYGKRVFPRLSLNDAILTAYGFWVGFPGPCAEGVDQMMADASRPGRKGLTYVKGYAPLANRQPDEHR